MFRQIVISLVFIRRLLARQTLRFLGCHVNGFEYQMLAAACFNVSSMIDQY